MQATAYTVEGDSVKKEFTAQILDFSKIPVQKADTTRYAEYKFKDSVVISASDKYKASYLGLRRNFLGANYRKAWSTPVTIREFNINKEKASQ